jgi:hypothetical protein
MTVREYDILLLFQMLHVWLFYLFISTSIIMLSLDVHLLCDLARSIASSLLHTLVTQHIHFTLLLYDVVLLFRELCL